MAQLKNTLEKPKSFYDVFLRKPDKYQQDTHYCPGCGHGILHKFIAEAIDDFGIADRTIMISPVGCSVFVYYYFDTGNFQVAHGRAPAVATGIKRNRPDSIVIAYQGDGDLGAIGGNNILQAANRGEDITVFFVNNAIYGMTGGQMAPTTLIGQKTMTSPYGRKATWEGYPLRMSELLSTLEAPAYIERVALTYGKELMKARKAVRKAIQTQIEGKGFSMVEALSMCPSGWRMTPVDAKKWVQDVLTKTFPLGVYKDVTAEREKGSWHRKFEQVPVEKYHEILGLTGIAKETKGDMSKVEEKYRNPEILIAGFGGQGVLLLGKTLAEAGMRHNWNSTWIPSYGPEMRGGTANCHVKISDGRIGSPVVDNPDILVVLNQPSLDRFEKDLKPGGLLIYNTTMIHKKPTRTDIDILPMPASEMADKLGSLRVANMVVVGAIMEKTNLFDSDVVFDALNTVVSHKKFIPMNVDAIKAGIDYVKNYKG